jgi:hypothetical protein
VEAVRLRQLLAATAQQRGKATNEAVREALLTAIS